MGIDIAVMRLRAGASTEDVASYAGVSPAELAEWERTHSVPRRHAAKVRWALWAVSRDAALASSGLRACAWLEHFLRQPTPDADLLNRHVTDCAACVARSRYIDEHVGPMPPMTSGILATAVNYIGNLSGMTQAAVTGSVVVLAMGGIGVLVLLARAIINMESSYLLTAILLLAVLVLSGAAGGLTFYLVRPLRDRGTLGYYAASMITVFGYLVAVAMLIGAGALITGSGTTDPEILEFVSSPAGLVGLLGVVVLFGIAFGRSMRVK